MDNIELKANEQISDLSEKKLVSIVVPMYNESENIDAFIEAIHNCIPQKIKSYELIFVDDGSSDQTWDMINSYCSKYDNIKGISLSRNFGHQHALFAGLHYAKGDAVISMDGDLQHPPEVIIDLLNKWRDGYKIVTTNRIDSDDTSFFKRITSKWFYKIFSKLSGMDMKPGNSDFRLVDRKVLESIKEIGDTHLFLRGVTAWVGFSTTVVDYKAANRFAGTSKYNLMKMIRFSSAAIVSFSIIPLKIGIWIGFITSFLAVIEIIYIIVTYLNGGAIAGWASVMTFMSLMFGILFFMVGIIGVYLGGISEILKKRPRFIVQETAGIK